MTTTHPAAAIDATCAEELDDNAIARLDAKRTPEENNQIHALWAGVGVKAYADRCGSTKEDLGTVIEDLLADLMHLADATELSFDGMLVTARIRYGEELAGEL